MVEINLREWEEDKNAKSISYFSTQESVAVDRGLIEALKQESSQRGNQNARFCLHQSPEDTLHDMIILEYKDKVCRKPHKHLSKNETLHIIEGKLDVFLFGEEGNLTYRTTLSPEKNSILRSAKNQYHLWLPFTEFIVYREIKQGPFQQEDNISTKWDYISILKNLVKENIDCFNPKCDSPCRLNQVLS